MKLCRQLLLLIVFALWTGSLCAQTLTEQLIAEDSAKLAELARQNGDVVRGAILFHQGNINCAKCHRPSAESDRIGPDLSRIDPEVTDAYIVESILQPSKSIKKGFETVAALMLDGSLNNGLVVTEDAEKIVLRDNENVDRLITILREDLDEVRPGTISSMPDGLINELKDRQQFLDLVHYVIDIKARGPTSDQVVARTSIRRELSPELKGLVLIQELNCIACHESETVQIVAAKQAPDLHWSGKWLNPTALTQFIADPNNIKPGTSMPHMLGNLDQDSRLAAANAITNFVLSKTENQFQVQSVDEQAVSRGFELFHSVGCVACHSSRDKLATEQSLAESLPLGDLSRKYNVDGLVGFLENPHAVRPSGRMPKMQLAHNEATDIANYLLQQSREEDQPWTADAALVDIGAALFVEFKCASCHTGLIESFPRSQVAMEQLKPQQGCLSGENGNWPAFHFEDQEKEFIQAALDSYPLSLDDQQQIAVSLKSFNCIACHDRNDFGGISAIRNPHFQTTNMNLGDQGRIPPTLTGVGAKLKPGWMRDVLVNGRTIRPYMKTRMPQYGESNIGHLVELFQKTDKLSATTFAKFEDQKEMRKMGLEMAGNKGLNCVACHTYKYKLSDTMPAVDLTEMADRLKKDWFHQYMLAPQKFSPNTVMPSFWPGGVAIRKDIPGDPAYQVEALWQYLIDGRQANSPSGVVRKPLEIVVSDEAQILRRSYPGIGKRGIGVGYPGGLNLAFDAEQMRLAMIWKGKFADPAGVWTGQGHGNVRPLGRPIDFPKGPELDDRNKPWIVDDGRPPNHQFQGYDLDALQRPTFRYRFENVEVKDFFSQIAHEDPVKKHLRRSILLSSGDDRDNLGFRLAEAREIADEGNGLFLIDKQLKIRIASDQKGRIVDGDPTQLRIPIKLRAGEELKLVIDYLWE